MDITLTLRHPKTDQKMTVRYNRYSYKHDVWENGVYIGEVRLRELYFNDFVCTDREFRVD